MMQTMIPVDELATVFSDLAPIPQDDGPEPVCVIQYPTSFVLAYNYMRAVWKSNEFSGALRVLFCMFGGCFARCVNLTFV
jgi:hypothetical protein